MNGYSLSRQYFDWAFEHPSENNPTMTALYLFIVEINNRLGWKEEFTITPRECLESIGISSYNTYKKNFDKLVENGFIKVVKPSKNQYNANVIALSKFDKADNKALDKALNNKESALSNFDNASEKHDTKHLTTQVKSTIQSTCDIHKTTNNKQYIIDNKEKTKCFSPPTLDEVIDFYIDPSGLNLTPSDAEFWANRFYDWYETVDWCVDKAKKVKMKNWKAAARRCVREWEDTRKHTQNRLNHPFSNYQHSNIQADERF